MSNDTVPAAATGLPKSILNRETVATLSMRDLYRVASILQGTADLLAYSEVARVVDSFVELLTSAVDDLVTVAEKRFPATPEEANFRGWMLAQHDAWVCTDLTAMALKTSESALQERRLDAERASA